MTTGENMDPTKPVPNCWMRNSVATMAMEIPTILAAQAAGKIQRVNEQANKVYTTAGIWA